MKRIAIAALLVSGSSLVLGQTIDVADVATRLDKARTEVNSTQNAADRALTAIKKPDIAKATTEINATKNAASRALYAIDKALEAVKPPHPPAPTPTPTPTPVPAASPDVPTGPGQGAKVVTSNFDVSTTLTPSWGSGAIAPVFASDVVGAFRFICGLGQLSHDDPIVYPGQPGKSHGHQYYGNTGANANSTFASLRESGDSTCNNMQNGTAANRSAYWLPWMEDGKGNVVNGDYVQAYYKREPDNSGTCTLAKANGGGCIGVPNGLKFIVGFDTVLGKPDPLGLKVHWQCVVADHPVAGTGGGDLTLINAQNCPPGQAKTYVEAAISSGKCWNGQLDSADHRSHFAKAIRNSAGDVVCPKTHPWVIPVVTFSVFWRVDKGDDPGLWRSSSDHMFPNLPRGITWHADYFEAWDTLVKDMWVQNCIGKKLNCSGGDLGNGKQLKGASRPIYGNVSTSTNPIHLVPIASIS